MSTVVKDTDRPVISGEQLTEINQKLDLVTQSLSVLSAQVNYLMERAEVERQRQQMWDDLFADLKPVLNDLYAATEEQLGEMQQFVTLDDIPELVKRLARNTRTLNEMLDLLESAHAFVKDASPLTRDMIPKPPTAWPS